MKKPYVAPELTARSWDVPDLAEVGAVALVDLTCELDPTFPRTPEMHEAAVNLMHVLASALACLHR